MDKNRQKSVVFDFLPPVFHSQEANNFIKHLFILDIVSLSAFYSCIGISKDRIVNYEELFVKSSTF